MLIQNIKIHENEVLSRLKELEKKGKFLIIDRIYYPYYFLEFSVKSKRKLMNGKIGCTIDGLSGKEAIIDATPEFSRDNHCENLNYLIPKIDEKQAKKIGEKFIFQSVIKETKYLSIPKIHFIKYRLFYRPFWIIEFKLNHDNSHKLIMDAISGKYHPI